MVQMMCKQVISPKIIIKFYIFKEIKGYYKSLKQSLVKYIMNKIFLRLLCLALIFSVCICQLSNNATEQSSDNRKKGSVKQIDEKRLSEVNYLINSYFVNCSLEAQLSLLYGCSIPKKKYAEFLYALFHKEHIMNFLKLYQADGKISSQNEISQMYKMGQKVHKMVVSAYNQWIDIYKPNANITVEQMYKDIVELDQQVLDVIQHYQEQYKEFIDVLEKIYNLQTKAIQYVLMGNNTEEQIAQDYQGILRVYFGDCQPIDECEMSLKAFVYFLKELSFYITPLVQIQSNKKSIFVSKDLDFKATQFLIQEVQKMKQILGETVDYSEIEAYSEEIAMRLFENLKDNHQSNHEKNQNTEHKIETQTQKTQL